MACADELQKLLHTEESIVYLVWAEPDDLKPNT